MKRSDRLNELIHDMRNRLTVARANMEAFIDGKLAPSAERLGAVLQSLNQIDELLKDFRATGAEVHADVHPAEINVCSMLDREYHAVEAVASAKGIEFTVQRCPVPDHLCTHFVGDPVRISQVLTNVLLNAVRYTPPGGAISVDCSRDDGDLAITIADNGPGLAPGEADKVFEPGYRGSAAEGTKGSGYGLAIARELVEAQGGSIAVESEPGRGARFTVRLPGTHSATALAGDPCARCRAGRSAD